jgi:tRNA(Ile)-lysidine synthase
VLKDFQIFIEQQLPFLSKSKVLVAVSGGVDSVVLAHLCHFSGMDMALAHCNFKLRGADSDLDEQFVKDLANKLGCDVFVKSFDTKAYMQQYKVSLQMAARELRYQWFHDLIRDTSFDQVLTAHHADDNLETFLINFTRGTGLNGLTGIPLWNEPFARPLLPFSREAILQFAQQESLEWREDISNSSRKYLRNKLRHDVVPALKEINPNLLVSFKQTLENLNDTADIVEESLNAVAKRAIVYMDAQEVHYKISEFKKVNNSKAYLHEMFKPYGFTEWEDVLHLLDAESGKFVKSTSHRLIKHREVLILTDLKPQEYKTYYIEENSSTFEFPSGTLTLKSSSVPISEDIHSIQVDKDKIQFPLTLRIWQQGDIFRPLGMKGQKKVSKYLKDEKLSLTEKERTWVLCSDDAIVWIIGKRADERFKVSNTTEEIIQITYQP